MKNPKVRAGKPVAAFLLPLARAVAAGQTDEVLASPVGPLPPKQLCRIRRRINASHSLHLENCIIFHSSGVSVSTLANWQGVAAIRLKGREHRFRLLAVDRFGQRTIFAIPMALLDKTYTLPGIDLSAAEQKLLLLMADELRTPASDHEYVVTVKHPAQADVAAQRGQWDMPFNESALLTLLQDRQWLPAVAAAALDVQLRTFKLFREAPSGIYNFSTCSSDLQADDAFTAALRAMNFTCVGQYTCAAPPEIIIKDKTDLQLWRGCVERVALLRTATGSLLKPIFKDIDERERLRACGGQLPPPLPTVPIVRCKAALCRPFTVDVDLPKGETSLTNAEQDLLRTAMSRVLTHETAQWVYNEWRKRMSSPIAYRIDGFRCWRETLAEAFLRQALQQPDCTKEIASLLRDTAAAQQAAEEAREQTIRRAIELISHPERFADEIIDRPGSRAEAARVLGESGDAVAFWYNSSTKNGDKCKFLAFSNHSLIRLLQRVSCSENLKEAVLQHWRKMSMEARKNHEIRLGKDTAKFITFQFEF